MVDFVLFRMVIVYTLTPHTYPVDISECVKTGRCTHWYEALRTVLIGDPCDIRAPFLFSRLGTGRCKGFRLA